MRRNVLILALAVLFVLGITLSTAAFDGVWGGDFAMIEQWGVMNNASITQDGYGYFGFHGGYYNCCGNNVAVIFQEGFGNTTTLNQSGSENMAIANSDGHGNIINQSQTGHYLTAMACQHGFGNTITQTQSGKRNLSFVTQHGVANTAVTTQSGGNYHCADMAVIGQHGFGNYASITQY